MSCPYTSPQSHAKSHKCFYKNLSSLHLCPGQVVNRVKDLDDQYLKRVTYKHICTRLQH